MRDYGKVHTSFWTSETTRNMSEDARQLALYLLTCPHGTLAGVFRLPDGYICDDLQWDSERVNKAFNETLDKGFANRCEITKWVWVIKHLEWNPPENPNQIKGALRVARLIPYNCSWKQSFINSTTNVFGSNLEPLPNPSETVEQPITITIPITELPLEEVETVVVQPSVARDSKKGASLPKDWQLPKKWGDWALTERPDWTADDVRRVADQFRDYWIANANQRTGKKADWEAAWRNWVRKEPPTKNQHQQKNGKPWFMSASGIEAKGIELGILKGVSEIFPDYRLRVFEVAGISEKSDEYKKAMQDYSS